MIKTEKSKYIKSVLLLLSTLLVPLQFFGVILYWLPCIYVGLVVPYLLWRIWFNKNNIKANPVSYLWKIPIIFILTASMFYAELFLIFIIPMTISFTAKIIIFAVLLFILRCFIYAMMIFIWQPDILKSKKKWAYLGVILYCATTVYFLYSIPNAPDTDIPESLMSNEM